MTSGSSALPCQPQSPPLPLHTWPLSNRPELAAHALIAVGLTTTLKTVTRTLFVPHTLYPLLQLSEAALPQRPSPSRAPHKPAVHPLTGSTSHSPVGTLTTQFALGPTADLGMSASSAVTVLTPSGTVPSVLPLDQHKLVTPLRPLELERELVNHPDKDFVSQLIHNLQHGCRIGYTGPEFTHIAHHLPSALAQPTVIDEALQKECRAGRMAGPYPHPPCTNLRCSGLGVVPKKDGGSRIIYHLSAPHGYSVNDFINPLDFSLSYCSIDEAIAMVNQLGPGALMGKIDLKSAFRLCPVRKQDWHYLGIHWKGAYYIDKCLPFGLRSAPFLFNLLASAIEWIAVHNYGIKRLIHYLDDFFTAGPPQSEVCHDHMRSILACATVLTPR